MKALRVVQIAQEINIISSMKKGTLRDNFKLVMKL
jgi:hypothetical protein